MIQPTLLYIMSLSPCSLAIAFKVLQEYGIEKSQFTSVISAPPPLGELPKGKYMQ